MHGARFCKEGWSSPDNIIKEIAINLLEDFLTLYTVCKLTFVKEKVQDYKIKEPRN